LCPRFCGLERVRGLPIRRSQTRASVKAQVRLLGPCGSGRAGIGQEGQHDEVASRPESSLPAAEVLQANQTPCKTTVAPIVVKRLRPRRHHSIRRTNQMAQLIVKAEAVSGGVILPGSLDEAHLGAPILAVSVTTTDGVPVSGLAGSFEVAVLFDEQANPNFDAGQGGTAWILCLRPGAAFRAK